MNGILGRKVGMTQVFTPDGRAVPVTAIEAGPCTVTAIRNPERDGYAAVQFGFGQVRRLNKPRLGHVRKATGNNETRPRVLREIRGGIEGAELGKRVTVDMVFAKGEYVDVIGTSKGKGFQGGVKRWHFRGGPKTTPPLRNCGAVCAPWRARPVPFCRYHLAVVPLTSPRVLVSCVPRRRFA